MYISTEQHGKTALHYAVDSGQTDVVDLLLKFGADCEHQDAEGVTPLHSAVKADSEPMTSLLISNGANIRTLCRGMSILTLARSRYHPPVIAALKEYILKRQEALVDKKACEKVQAEDATEAPIEAEDC
ncbi:hypothetical protein SARC_08565 [Sphaeroforma arctica JP610]|uniref:Uncharacterized protein n=1 Tax=Sphaeroforma arctica JP610 TaxID=667725 RepID=A0A0L0FQN5_9EUKA|nr:hypothetical protein SARC_08565 [Sphaeroforma arctica JP610]KNC79024.1 hypothetical protein SARC_08565 [Sphaeroforma arctica JP610]|eukprot:XP_014152926.1 hypothetical protein SARC_08565 [Sphaeroforma arctica JP610]